MCYGALQIKALQSKLGPYLFSLLDPRPEPGWSVVERISYPLSPIFFIRQEPGHDPELCEGQYGLVPAWVTDAKGGLGYGKHCYNARSETVFEKPSFRDPILRRRAVVPVTGYLEVQDLGEAPGRHFRVRREGGEPIYLAGLWDYNERYKALSCSILTSEPQPWIADKHSRSPILLGEAQIARWLDPALKDKDEIRGFLQIYRGAGLKMEYFTPEKAPKKGPQQGSLDL